MVLNLNKMGKSALEASHRLATLSTAQKNHFLEELAQLIEKEEDRIIKTNLEDIKSAKATGMSEAMIDRLSLEGRIQGIVKDIRNVISLPDPVGTLLEERTLPNQLHLSKIRTPIGVLGVIYESRPNVTLDVASLSIKTGNCAILRGGSETLRTNQHLIQIIQQALENSKLPREAIQLIDNPDRSLVGQLLKLDKYVSMIIPRGGAGLHRFCKENSTIPVITGGIGICHLFVDQSADLKKSLEVIINAKTQRPTVCNALDTVLVHESIAKEFIPLLIKQLDHHQVELRFEEKAWEIAQKITTHILKKEAVEGDWDTEWLALILGIKIVSNLEEAVHHIQIHSSGHSDGILTEDQGQAEKFISAIDSACVYVNASTRFTDGAEFGLGAEVAISTQKLHARGPMGPVELTSYKWVIKGKYQIR